MVTEQLKAELATTTDQHKESNMWNSHPQKRTYASKVTLKEPPSFPEQRVLPVKNTPQITDINKSQVDKHHSLVIRNIQDRKFIKDSPSIKKEFSKYFKDCKVISAFPTRSGALIIELSNRNDAEKVYKNWKPTFFCSTSLAAQEQFRTSCEILSDIKNLRAILKNVDRHLTDEEITLDLSKQFAGASFKRFVNRDKEALKVGLVSLSSQKHLDEILKEDIYLGNILVNVEEYKPRRKVIQCYNCKQFDHVRKWCPNKYSCTICSKQHPDNECQTPSQPSCTNCKQDHSSLDKKCPIFIQKLNINNALINRNLHE